MALTESVRLGPVEFKVDESVGQFLDAYNLDDAVFSVEDLLLDPTTSDPIDRLDARDRAIELVAQAGGPLDVDFLLRIRILADLSESLSNFNQQLAMRSFSPLTLSILDRRQAEFIEGLDFEIGTPYQEHLEKVEASIERDLNVYYIIQSLLGEESYGLFLQSPFIRDGQWLIDYSVNQSDPRSLCPLIPFFVDIAEQSAI